jgi:dGTPase
MCIREQIEERERAYLSPFATLSAASAGRLRSEPLCPVRTIFQRDRDRIIHLCRAFRRLAQKTQVFISPREDHLRTRLSHTLEVSQIARTIAKALRLSEDLIEAIALAHDVGHTPFGHAGEDSLDEAYRSYDAAAHFAHHEHSLRVVDVLERQGQGLNLAQETRDGIVSHSKSMNDLQSDFQLVHLPTLEAMVVRVADRIAYLNHDLDDCLRVGFLSPEQVPRDIVAVLGERHSQRVGAMVRDLIGHSLDRPRLNMSNEIVQATDALKNFLVEYLYQSPRIRQETNKVDGIIRGLFNLYMEDDQAFSEIAAPPVADTPERARLVCDYIAGMTDRFARAQYLHYFLPTGLPSFEQPQ